jgi:Ca2+-binding EF-hand superfamily protein
VTESEVQAIIKRIDTDRDGRISFTEFKRFFSFPAVGSLKDSYKSEGVGGLSSSNFFSTKSSLGKFDSPLRRTASPQRGLRYVSPNRSARYTSPLRTTYRSPVRSPVRVSSPMRSPVRARSPIRSTLSPVRSTNLSIKSVDRTRVGPSLTSSNFGKTFFSTYPSYEEENFLNFLRDVMVIENDIERSKSDLALRSDFNIEDAFRIFELDGRGYLSDLDLKFGLNSLDLFPTSEEISLLIKRFDPRNEGVLSFANFFDAVAPIDREYRRMLEVRLPSAYPTRNKADVFLPSTKLYFQNLLSLILKSEARVEGWRQRLNKMPRFSVRTTFDRIDRLEKNYITEADVYYFIILKILLSRSLLI